MELFLYLIFLDLDKMDIYRDKLSCWTHLGERTSSEEREPLGARGLVINSEILSILQNKLNNFLFCWRSFAFGLKKKR